MADSEKSKLIRILQALAPIVGTAVAVIGLFIGLSGRKKELVCAYLGSDKLVSLDAGGISAAVKVEYQGQPVTSLMKMRFVVRNTGSSAIKGEDVREPITLYFPKAVQLLNSSVDRTSPTQFTFQVVPNPADNTVICSFPLLNSGDEAYFSVFAYNSIPVAPEVRGRIVDVREIQNVDDSRHQQANPFPYTSSPGVRRVLYWVLVTFNAILCLLFAVLDVALAWAFAEFKAWKTKWQSKWDDAQTAVGASLKAGTVKLSDRDTALAQELLKRGVPKRPDPPYANWKGFFRVTFVLSVLSLLFAGSTIFEFLSFRGY
jgi:hypothetical protein